LSLSELINFATDIVGKPIPLPDDSMMHFEQVALTLLTWVSIGTTAYAAESLLHGDHRVIQK